MKRVLALITAVVIATITMAGPASAQLSPVDRDAPANRVELFYEVFLDRTPSVDEQAYWVEQLPTDPEYAWFVWQFAIDGESQAPHLGHVRNGSSFDFIQRIDDAANLNLPFDRLTEQAIVLDRIGSFLGRDTSRALIFLAMTA